MNKGIKRFIVGVLITLVVCVLFSHECTRAQTDSAPGVAAGESSNGLVAPVTSTGDIEEDVECKEFKWKADAMPRWFCFVGKQVLDEYKQDEETGSDNITSYVRTIAEALDKNTLALSYHNPKDPNDINQIPLTNLIVSDNTIRDWTRIVYRNTEYQAVAGNIDAFYAPIYDPNRYLSDFLSEKKKNSHDFRKSMQSIMDKDNQKKTTDLDQYIDLYMQNLSAITQSMKNDPVYKIMKKAFAKIKVDFDAYLKEYGSYSCIVYPSPDQSERTGVDIASLTAHESSHAIDDSSELAYSDKINISQNPKYPFATFADNKDEASTLQLLSAVLLLPNAKAGGQNTSASQTDSTEQMDNMSSGAIVTEMSASEKEQFEAIAAHALPPTEIFAHSDQLWFAGSRSANDIWNMYADIMSTRYAASNPNVTKESAKADLDTCKKLYESGESQRKLEANRTNGNADSNCSFYYYILDVLPNIVKLVQAHEQIRTSGASVNAAP